VNDRGQLPHLCPACGGENGCQLVTSNAYKGPCWCMKVEVSAAALARLPQELRGRPCLCERCLGAVANGEPVRIVAEELVPNRDYHLEEQGTMVFTAEFLTRRGYCCGSGCRNCPY